MRQRITIILTFVVIIGLLVILNSITYVNQEKAEDSEITPNRSTYHAGPTGTRALHDLLNESGYKVIRWRETPQKLLGESGKLVTTFVVIGRTKVQFKDDEAASLREWVRRGGRLVVIDRQVDHDLVPISDGWTINAAEYQFPSMDDNPSDVKRMTLGVTALAPVQPTVLTSTIQEVMPSRFASRMQIILGGGVAIHSEDDETSTPPPPAAAVKIATGTRRSEAPVAHIADSKGALLVDYAYGAGKIVVLSDPYIVANRGIKLNDNLQLAINTLASQPGLIAFDEYHQGRGITQNAFASYFAGTPVLAIGAQLMVVILLVLWTNARRFGRPLPLPHVDRRSSLEFVASMAELQERSRAFDLAIENIYTRTRRVLARYAGVDYNSSRSEIATRVAERSTIDSHKLEALMRQCEEAINGEQINWRQSLDLVRRLRAVERQLGLGMRLRDERQAAENI